MTPRLFLLLAAQLLELVGAPLEASALLDALADFLGHARQIGGTR